MEPVSAPPTLDLRPGPGALQAFSDDQLVDEARRGDQEAFEHLYDRHHRGVLSFCRHMLRSEQAAEEVTQRAFVAACNEIQRDGEREIHFKALLYTIARNHCGDVVRSRRDLPTEELDLGLEHLSKDLQQRADLEALLSQIRVLPPTHREALVLSEVADLSYLEISTVLGCPEAKVKELVFDARTALIEHRVARETPCERIREQIATLRDDAYSYPHLRQHIGICPECSEYQEAIGRQRHLLELALPVVPSLALRDHIFSALGMGGASTASGAAAVAATAASTGGAGIGVAGMAAKAVIAKAGIAALIAGGAAGGVAANGGLPWTGGGHAVKHAPAGVKARAASRDTISAPPGFTGKPGEARNAAARGDTAGRRHHAKKHPAAQNAAGQGTGTPGSRVTPVHTTPQGAGPRVQATPHRHVPPPGSTGGSPGSKVQSGGQTGSGGKTGSGGHTGTIVPPSSNPPGGPDTRSGSDTQSGPLDSGGGSPGGSPGTGSTLGGSSPGGSGTSGTTSGP